MSALDDELDYQILKLLQKDGRMSFTEISKEINVAVSTIRHRFINLVEDGTLKIIGRVDPNKIGFNAYALGIVSPFELKAASSQYLGNINDLDDICRINQIDDIIFCSKDVTSTQIMYWMSKMGGKYQFRIMQESNASIISSYSKNDPGELFTYRIHLNLADPRFLKQKRLFDVIICLVYLMLIPFFILLQRKSISRRMGQWLAVLKGERTWIGYGKETLQDEKQNLPSIPDGILTLSDISYAFNKENPSKEKVLAENIIYARHYTINADVNKLFQYVFSRIK